MFDEWVCATPQDAYQQIPCSSFEGNHLEEAISVTNPSSIDALNRNETKCGTTNKSIQNISLNWCVWVPFIF